MVGADVGQWINRASEVYLHHGSGRKVGPSTVELPAVGDQSWALDPREVLCRVGDGEYEMAKTLTAAARCMRRRPDSESIQGCVLEV